MNHSYCCFIRNRNIFYSVFSETWDCVSALHFLFIKLFFSLKIFFFSPKMKICHRRKISGHDGALKEIWQRNYTPNQKRKFQRLRLKENSLKLVCYMQRGTILKKINVSFIVHFCLGKYSLSPDVFLTHFVYQICSLVDVLFMKSFYAIFKLFLIGND